MLNNQILGRPIVRQTQAGTYPEANALPVVSGTCCVTLPALQFFRIDLFRPIRPFDFLWTISSIIDCVLP